MKLLDFARELEGYLRNDYDAQRELFYIFCGGLFVILLGYFVYAEYFRHAQRAVLASLAAFLPGLALSLTRIFQAMRGDFHGDRRPFDHFDLTTWDGLKLDALYIFLAAWFAIPLLVRLYDAWRQSSAAGSGQPAGKSARGGWNLFWVLGTILFSGLGFGFLVPFILMIIFGVAATCLETGSAAPAGAVATRSSASCFPSTPCQQNDELASERNRVLRLLEEGKITAEECSELLTALGESARATANVRPPLGLARKMAFLGLGLVIVGFLLPWLSVDVNKLTQQMGQQMNSMMQGVPGMQSMPGLPGNINLKFNGTSLSGGVLRISGGDVPHGLGWIILVLAVVAVFIPFITHGIQPLAQRSFGLITLGIGAFIIFYILTETYQFAGIGLVVVLAGYALALAGVARDRTANE